MPLFSLPGEGGIGDIGKSSYDLIDRLSDLGANYWQILPLNLIDETGCPYASPSAFGCEPLLIDTAALGIAYQEDFSHEIDYGTLRETKRHALDQYAKEKLKSAMALEKVSSLKECSPWLEDLCCFLTLRDAYGEHWKYWPDELKSIEEANKRVRDQYQSEFHVHLYLQFVVHQQWQKLKEYAELKNIEIIGDIPIFVSADSFDAWRWTELFKIDQESGNPLVITGAPPDEFNEDGQLWGTINYNWDHPQLNDWWLKRLDYSQSLYHKTRIDHFVGLYHVWESAPDANNAKLGTYVPSQGRRLLEAIEDHFETKKQMPFIAEDLGVLNDNIRKLREDFAYPTMRVYQFSLEEQGKPQTKEEVNEHTPENVPPQSFYYSGTHDNNTLRGWLDEVIERPKKFEQLSKRFTKILGSTPAEPSQEWSRKVMNQILDDLLASSSQNVIFPLQDIFHLPESARINIPGTNEGNWLWRFSYAQWDEESWQLMRERLIAFNRGQHA